MNNSINLKSITNIFKSGGKRIYQYRVLIALCVVVGIYGFVVWRIQTLDNLTPSANQVNAQTNPAIGAHIDKSVVNQLQQLRDNSVNVQALFDQGRNNPFEE